MDGRRSGGNGHQDRAEEVARRRDMDRADFFKWAAGLSLGGTALLSSVAAAKAITPPERSIDGKTKMPPTALAKVADLKEGTPVAFEYGDDMVFLTKQGEKVIALSAACPHVACKVAWDDAKKEFACPCHASFFTLEGRKKAGPALRDLDKAIFAIKDGQVVVSGFDKPA